jgi:hypothetical protein
MALEQCGWAKDRGDFRDSAAAHEEHGQSDHKSVEAGQIRRALSGTIDDHELMLEQQRFCGDGASATRAEEFRDDDEQMDYQEEQIAHQVNRTMTASARKAARRRRIPSYYEFATHTLRRSGGAASAGRIVCTHLGERPRRRCCPRQ